MPIIRKSIRVISIVFYLIFVQKIMLFPIGILSDITLYDYNSGEAVAGNGCAHYLLYPFGCDCAGDCPQIGPFLPNGSNEVYWLRFRMMGEENYRLRIVIDPAIDDQYFISFFNWQPGVDFMPDPMNHIPATPPLSIDTETQVFDISGSSTINTILVMIRPEAGRTWNQDFVFALKACNIPSGEPIGVETCVVKTLNIPITMKVEPEELPLGTVGNAFSQTISTSGGAAPYHFQVTSGSLPAGFTLSEDTGLLEGTPLEVGAFEFTIKVSDTPFSTNVIQKYVNKQYILNVDKFLVKFQNGIGGILDGITTQFIAPGGSTSEVSAIPGEGYHFVNWTETGGFTLTENPLVIDNIDNNMLITANFAINTYTISGTIITTKGAPLEGVVLSGLPGTPATNSSGQYSAIVNYGFTGTVAPAKNGYSFTPVSFEYTNVFASYSGKDYLALSATAIPLIERQALIALFNSTGGDLWTANAGWKTPPLDTDGFALRDTENNWHGITVENGHVIRIFLKCNLNGSIPPELGNLNNLSWLILSENQLSGSIPASLGNLINLDRLWLSNNQLTGSIPAELGNLNNLITLSLYYNQLSGGIPSSLGNLSNLGYLYLSSNQLSENIPASFGNLSNLVKLDIHNNQLTGNIPDCIGNLTKLTSIDLSDNKLSGNIPSSLGNLTILGELRLSNNQLSGIIPNSLGNLISLRSLQISNNAFSGMIPVSLKNLIYLIGNEANTNFQYNALYTYDTDLISFLNSVNPNWVNTQTVAPTNVLATSANSNSVNLNWNNIRYIGHSGGYRVSVGTTPGGPYTFFQQTSDKSTTSLPVTGLNPSTPYYFVISTRTDSHDEQQNTIDSENSAEVSASTVPDTYTISGNAGIGGATLSYTDGSLKTATAAGNGSYSFTVSYNWSGIVTPSITGYSFTPASRTYTNVLSDQTSQDYTASPTIFTISGNAGIAGATLSYTDGGSKTATADGSGNYSFTISYNWSGTVTPSYSGYSFAPTNRIYTNVLSNQTSQDYTATPINYTISGNAGAVGVTLSYNDGTPKTATSDGSGNYSFTVSYNWSGTVTPSLAGYTFTPANRTYTNVLSNQTSQDYTVTAIRYNISGNAGIGGATLSYTDGSAKTATAAGNGSYSFTVSYNWSGTVTPSITGYNFTPDSRTYVNVLSDQTSQDYTATPIRCTISGNAGIAGATLSYTDGGSKTATSDGSGNYSFTVSYNWSGTVTPSLTGYNFSPLNRSYTNVLSNQVSQDFSAALITFTVTFVEGTGGTITGTKVQTVNYGANASEVTAVANIGYHFVNWTNAYSGTDNPLTITNVTSDLTITANFAINQYTVTFIEGPNGTITGTKVQTINHGDSATQVEAVANNGYHFTGWTGGYSGSDNPLTIPNITSDLTVTVNFAINQYTVTFIEGSGGTITGTKVQTVNHGDSTAQVEAVPNAGYHFTGWIGGYTGSDNPLTIPNVTSDLTITGNFAINQYMVTFIEGSNGTITGSKVQTINYGESTSPVTAVGNTNYHFVDWTSDYSGSDNPLTVTNVTSDLTITANFAIDTYSVTFTASTGGYITGDSSQTVEHGGSAAAVTAAADPSFHFVNWTGDYAGTDNPLTITNVIADMAVTANFVANLPQSERDALIALFNATGGSSWTNKSGWQDAPLHSDGFAMPGTEGEWFGVTVINGHVTQIDLPANNVTGSLPAGLGNLPQLLTLRLENNGISGQIPSTFGNLTGLTVFHLQNNDFTGSLPTSLANLTGLSDTDIGYNGLFTHDSALQSFMNGKDPDWANTQTIAPVNVTATPVNSTTINLIWDAITYTGNTGGYRIYVGTSSGGPYSFFQQTSDKTITSLPVTGLNPGTRYYFVIQTRTDPHGDQINTVNSENSAEASAITIRVHTVTFLAGSNGTLSGTTTQVVEHGSSCSAVTANANAGYHFVDWTGTGGFTSTDNLLTVTNVTGDMTITANFLIDDSITVTSPNGGERWAGGDIHNITWASAGTVGNVNIDYSTNNGSNWTFIAASTDNDGTYPWTVPNTSSTSCLVRIYEAADNDPTDTSNAVFTIVMAETVSTPTTPTGPSIGTISTSYDFSTGGSTSSLGHAVQYKFDWDDGADSGWLAQGMTSASHAWSANDTYHVRAMARCVTHTDIESLWSDTHAILISTGGAGAYFNSPAQRLILPEVNWASASGGGDWVSEVQITDVTGGSVIQVYYNSGTNRRGPFTLWNNGGGAAGSSRSWSNMLQTIDGLDAGAFTYYGTGGSLEMITQDNSHKLQAAIRSYNGNYSRTFPALADVETNTAASGRTMIVPNMSMDTNFRPSLVLFNPCADSVTANVQIIGGNGSQVGSTITKTVAGYEMTGVAGLRNDTYSNADIRVTVTGGSGRLIVSGQSANNTSNDPAAHLAVQTGPGYVNSPATRLIFPEVNWASASGGGDWISELHITDLSGGAVVQVYYNSGTNRRGPFTLWTNSGGANCSVTFSNILQTIDSLDAGAFTYYGTGGALELVTQDGSHLIQAALKGYNGNATRTFPAFQDCEANTAALGRDVMIPNLSNDTQYRPSVALFNTTADSVTIEARIIGSNGAQIGSTLTKTLAGYEMGGVTGLRNTTYSNASVRITVSGGSGRVLASGQSANNTSNDPAAHIAVQGQ